MQFFCVDFYRSVLKLLEERMTKESIENMLIVGGLVMVQFVYAGNSLLMSYLMSLGLGPFTIVIFSTFATFLILSPFAILFERSVYHNLKKTRLGFFFSFHIVYYVCSCFSSSKGSNGQISLVRGSLVS